MQTVKSTSLALAIVAIACMIVQAQPENKTSGIGSAITKETAQKWIQNFKSTHPNELHGYTYSKLKTNEVFASPQTEGIYIFNGLDGDGTMHLVLKAADKDGEIIENGVAYDNMQPCPPFCPQEDNIASIGSRIAEGLAQQWIENFQKNANGRVNAYLFGKDIFSQILSKENIEGIFFAYALDENQTEHLVLTGVTKDGEFAWDPAISLGRPCPGNCPTGYPTIPVAKKN